MSNRQHPDTNPRRFMRFLAERRRARRREAAQLAVLVDQSKVAARKAHEMATAFVFGEPDRLAGHRLADEDVFAAPFDRAVGRHTPTLMIGVVTGLVDARRHRAAGVAAPGDRPAASGRAPRAATPHFRRA